MGQKCIHMVIGFTKVFLMLIVTVFIVCFNSVGCAEFIATGNTDPTHVGTSWTNEVEVTFDETSAKMIFQLPTLAIMLTENGYKYINGWSEAYDPIDENPNAWVEGESYEAINDETNQHNRYWIESQNDARIVVRHRCAMFSSTKGIIYDDLPVITPFGEAGEWTDEWYVIHADGTHVRKVRVYTHHASESQWNPSSYPGKKYVHELEGMYMWGGRVPGRLVQDELEAQAMTLIRMDGQTQTFNFDPYPIPVGASGNQITDFYGEFGHSNIHVVNTKSEWRPYRIGRPSTSVPGSGFWEQSLLMTPYIPVHPLGDSLMPSFPDGCTRATGYDVAGLGQVGYWDHWEETDERITELWLNGFIRSDVPSTLNTVLPIAKSWIVPPEMTTTNDVGATVYGYDMVERAYLIDYESVTSIERKGVFKISASSESPVYNPTLLINNWGGGICNATLKIDGVEVPRGSDLRIGFYETIDIDDGREWRNTLIVWMKMSSTEDVDIEIWPESFVAVGGSLRFFSKGFVLLFISMLLYSFL